MITHSVQFITLRSRRFIFLLYTFIWFCFFPFVQLFPLGTDSQPNALLIAILVFIIKPVFKINKNFFLLLILFLFTILLLFFSKNSFSSFRSLFNYFSLFFLTFISYYVLSLLNGIPYKLYCITIYVWFIVGLIQMFFFPSFLSFLISRGDSSATLLTGRGIVCLTPEPTFYGIMCLLFIMIGYLNFKNVSGMKWLYFLLLIQLFLFSLSSMCLFLLVISFLFFSIYKIFISRNIKKIFIYFFCVMIVYILLPFVLNFFVNLRFGILLNKLWYTPLTFVTLDASVNERFNHIFFPLYGCFENYGLPHGFDSFEAFMNKCFGVSKFQDFFSDYIINASYHRIMSAIGGAFFELGIMAFIIIIVIYRAFKPLIHIDKNNTFFNIIYWGLNECCYFFKCDYSICIRKYLFFR